MTIWKHFDTQWLNESALNLYDHRWSKNFPLVLHLVRSFAQVLANDFCAGQLVQATKFFNGLDPADCEAIGRKLKSHHTVENQVVVETGDNADRFYLVLRGQLQVLVNGLVVTSKGPADTFGEI